MNPFQEQMKNDMNRYKSKAQIDDLLDRAEKAHTIMISNIIGLPILAARMAQLAATIKNNQNIKTKEERYDFLLNDLSCFSKKLKAQDCLAYIFIDKYIENLKEISINELKQTRKEKP